MRLTEIVVVYSRPHRISVRDNFSIGYEPDSLAGGLMSSEDFVEQVRDLRRIVREVPFYRNYPVILKELVGEEILL